MQVLVVERSSESAEAIAGWLRTDGHACTVAVDARQAIRAARSVPPDTAVVDLSIAQVAGPHLAARLRSLSPGVRIVVMSPPGEFDADLVARLRVCDWLVTPVARGELLRVFDRPHRPACGLGPEPVEAFHALLRRRNRAVADAAVRIQHWARLIGEDLRLGARQVDEIGYAALLEEVGRLGLPPALDGMDAPAEPGERALFETHPDIGRALLASVYGLGRVAAIVQSAHERFDGSGYPRGLAGRAIPLGARIVAVADAWETCVRREKSDEAAGAALARDAGTAFDPEVVACWVRVAARRFAPSGALSI